MTAPNGTPESGTVRGFALAILSAALVTVLLFLPVVLLGYTFSVVMHVIRGEALAWQSVVGLTYGVLGVPALLGILLLFVPSEAARAPQSFMGDRIQTTVSPDAPYYWVAFGLVAAAFLIATLAVAKRAAPAGSSGGA